MKAEVRSIEIIRVGDESVGAVTDVSAAEEPLELRLHGVSFVVTMRTPGADLDLAAGFLLSENIVRRPEDIGTMSHAPPHENILYVTLGADAARRAAAAMQGRRHVTVT